MAEPEEPTMVALQTVYRVLAGDLEDNDNEPHGNPDQGVKVKKFHRKIKQLVETDDPNKAEQAKQCLKQLMPKRFKKDVDDIVMTDTTVKGFYRLFTDHEIKEISPYKPIPDASEPW